MLEGISDYYHRKIIPVKKNIGRIENLLYDLYYQREFLGRTKITPFAHLDSFNSSTTSYSKIKEIFGHLTINRNDVLVDVGCAKGRVINCWLSLGLRN